jgi:hypothetical protein
VRRHVVGPFGVVLEQRVAVRDQPRQEPLEVAAHGRVGVFRDEQRGAGVVHEDVRQAGADPDAATISWTRPVMSVNPGRGSGSPAPVA